MASSSADCVFGVARLISSARHRLAYTGHVLDQQVASSREPDNGELGLGVLANQDLLNSREQILEQIGAVQRRGLTCRGTSCT
jgi:hypothetical protein